MSEHDKKSKDNQNHEEDLQEHKNSKGFETDYDQTDGTSDDSSYEMQAMLSSNALNSIKELNETITNLSQSIQLPDMRPIIEPIIKQQKESIDNLYRAMQSPALKQINGMSEQLRSIVKSLQNVVIPHIDIDFGKISEIAREKLEEIKELQLSFEKDLWCLDIDVLDYISTGDITEEELTDYVQKNINEYVEELVEEPMFRIHKSLLIETLEAYKSGYYKLCTYSLFSIIENIVTSWYIGEEITTNPNVRGLYHKINSLTEKLEEKIEFMKIFILSVFNIFIKLFETNNEYLNNELNRHTIAHGSHDYDSIKQIDVLKLFQLLKASLVLRDFKSEEILTFDS